MSSSWPDSPTTWLSSRTDNPPRPLPPCSTHLVLRENTSSDRLFLQSPPPLMKMYQKHPSSRMSAASSSPTHTYLCPATNTPVPAPPPVGLHCCIIFFVLVLFAAHLMCKFGSDFKGSSSLITDTMFLLLNPTAEVHSAVCTVHPVCSST